VPHHPEDDWTRPIPRTPRGRSDTDEHPDERTELVGYGRPRGAEDRGADHAGGRSSHGYAGDEDRYDDRYDDRHDQPYGTAGRGAGDEGYEREVAAPPRRPGGPGGRPPRRRRPRYGLRRALAVVLLLVLAYVGAMVWAVTSVWNSIDRVDSTPTSANRPEGTAGTTFVMVGTDSREDLSREERNDLVTGHATEGARADTIMLLHLPSSGDPVLISVPRDSYVEIPGHGFNKINASYQIGGPALLVDTIEQNTGLGVAGYLEVGFGGFVQVVEKVGGVHMCLDEPVQDEKTKLDLPAGCQDLVGREALNYVRMRYSDPRGDLGRVERQREFLSALVAKTATPGTIFVPWRLNDVGTAIGSNLAIGEDTSMWETGRMALAMRSVAGGDGQSLTVPVADANYPTSVGSTVLWDEAAAEEMFGALRDGRALTIEP
jgi:LCP family protein required for cell wall assembly